MLSDATITRRIDRIVSPARPGNEAPPDMASLTPEQQIEAAILTLWHAMEQCIERGMHTEGTLPGGLNVRRRAPGLAARAARWMPKLRRSRSRKPRPRDPLAPLDTVTMVAMAVNEENAAGGRVVTAPTNGAAGVVPAIAYYYLHHASKASATQRGAGPAAVLSDGGGDRDSLQGECVDLRRGGGLPGRGGRGVLDGRGWAGGGAGRRRTRELSTRPRLRWNTTSA